MMPKVSIIFPTFNGLEDTRECLFSITKLRYPKSKMEVIIIDNGSTDNTIPFIRKNFPWVKIFVQKKNFGFAKAVNLGIERSNGEYLLITNNDVIFEKNYLVNLVIFLQKNPKVGIVGGKIYYKHPKNKVAFSGAKFNFYTGLLSLNKKPNKVCETDWNPGCNMFVKKKVFDKIGQFDEKFFFYFEDLDFCLRAKRAGYQVIYHPRAILWHGEGASINRQNWQKKSEFYYQGKTRVLFKHATKIQLVSSLLFQFSFGLAYQLFILKHQNYTPAIQALAENVGRQRLK